MTIKEIVVKYAEEHGFDGLVLDKCGCSIEKDFAPCGSCIENCSLAYVCPCNECDDETKSKCEGYQIGGLDYLVLSEKCEKRIELEKLAWEKRNA